MPKKGREAESLRRGDSIKALKGEGANGREECGESQEERENSFLLTCKTSYFNEL